ncbi:hypothetical protein CRUP_016384 [Coryphaenoides rupestris]|nr:hypothetical protein CRUP_016384 [Coryphaenoides rupestris]
MPVTLLLSQYHPKPSCLQATVTSLTPQVSPQTRPQVRLRLGPGDRTSTRPSWRVRPPVRRICPRALFPASDALGVIRAFNGGRPQRSEIRDQRLDLQLRSLITDAPLQTTLAACRLQRSSHTVPHALFFSTSTRPSPVRAPPFRRTLDWTIPMYGTLQRTAASSVWLQSSWVTFRKGQPQMLRSRPTQRTSFIDALGVIRAFNGGRTPEIKRSEIRD